MHLQALRFVFEAREDIHFPHGASSNILRGAFGTIFRQIVCTPECHSASTCKIRLSCPYARLFEPTGPSPSGLADWPRPFVFRAGHLDGLTIPVGSGFHFALNLFDLKSNAENHLAETFAKLANEGLGPGRKKVNLLKVESKAVNLSLTAQARDETKLLVRFVTPTELKAHAQIALKPEFGILMARIRDRISTLCQLYGDGAPVLDYKAFAERASRVQMTRCDVRQVDIERRSSRTHQVHSIGGFIGEAEYDGELGEFVPWLEAAKWTGVGRQTVWGKGVIELFL